MGTKQVSVPIPARLHPQSSLFKQPGYYKSQWLLTTPAIFFLHLPPLLFSATLGTEAHAIFQIFFASHHLQLHHRRYLFLTNHSGFFSKTPEAFFDARLVPLRTIKTTTSLTCAPKEDDFPPFFPTTYQGDRRHYLMRPAIDACSHFSIQHMIATGGKRLQQHFQRDWAAVFFTRN